MEFKNLNFAYLLIIIPIITTVYLLYWRWSKKRIYNVFGKRIVNQIKLKNNFFLNPLKFILYQLSIFCIIVACMDPVTKSNPIEKEINRVGVDVFFALDISKSMLCEDVKPNRIKKSKQILSEVIESLKGDKTGVIVYAAGASVISPLTLDYAWVKNQIKDIDTDILSSQGTDLSSAIELSINSFNNDEKSKCLFIFSDGEDHENSYEKFVNEVNKKNVIINTIFIGTERGGVIPIKKGNNITFKKDSEGNKVLSKGNIEALKEIADKANGKINISNNNREIVTFILDTINEMEKGVLNQDFILIYNEKKQFHWFMFMALFFLLFDFVIKKNE